MTAHNFLLAFGGTGARCVEAYAYLAACGAAAQPTRVLMIDPDQANGNVAHAREQLQRYQKLQSAVEESGAGPACFHTPVNAALGSESCFWQYPNPNQPFGTLIKSSALPTPEGQLLSLLYDNDDLGLSFEQGYIGRAHIGSLDLVRTLRSSAGTASGPSSTTSDALQTFLRDLRAAAQSKEMARLIVCGSVFGGTGASGLPAVPPLLRELLPEGLRGRIAVGCVQVGPYFSFPPGGADAPDSALHALATQAALYHYAHTKVGYERIYLLGAPSASRTNDDNFPGGAAQQNRAHYVELGAALAITHFFDSAGPSSEAALFTSGARTVELASLPHGDLVQLRKKLLTLSTLCWIYHHYLQARLARGHHSESRWAEDLARVAPSKLGGQESELTELGAFAARFLAWVSDVGREHDAGFLQDAHPTTAALGSLAGGGSDSPDNYHDFIARLNKVPAKSTNSAIGWYIYALSQAASGFCADAYKSWWR